MPSILYFLSLCNLTIGTSAFVLGGIVAQVAVGLSVTPATAGQAMTFYALSTALLAPFALLITSKWQRRVALSTALFLMALGGLICAASESVIGLYAGRVVMGIGAVFTPMASGIAVASVDVARRGQALSTTFLGMSFSYVLGIPLGNWISTHYGWRWAIGSIALASALMALLCWYFVPKTLQVNAGGFTGISKLLKNPRVIKNLLVTLLYFSAIFSVFSYIGPVLSDLQPQLSASGIGIVLAIFGIAGVVGTVSGGWATDKFGARTTLLVQMLGMGLMMTVLPFTATQPPIMVVALFIWGVCGFGMMTPQQSSLASIDISRAPLLLSLNTSMLYFGTAIGAIAGGLAGTNLGYGKISWAAAVFCVAAFLVLVTYPKVRRT
jgi:MFS transporter, DHA1 family, inner membrane transport protein